MASSQPPVAPRAPRTVRHGSQEATDDWAWLRDRDDPAVREHLEAENAWAEAWLAPTRELQERLFEELRARIQETDESPPWRKDGWAYWSRTVEGLQYGISCRRRLPDGPEEVVLDANVLAEGHPYFDLGPYAISPSQQLLAYGVDVAGDEVYELRIRDLERGEDTGEVVPRVGWSAAWSADDRHLFYTRPDDAMRQHQVWRHEIGTPADQDVLVHQEDDRRFELGVGITRSERFIVVEATSHTTSESRVLPAERPLDPLVVVEPRRQGHEYRLDHQGDRFLIVTNDVAPSFRVVEAPVSSPGSASWREVVPEREGVTVVDVDALARHVLVSERCEGLVRLRVLDDGAGDRLIGQPEPVYEVHGAPNAEYDTSTYRFVYTSMTTPQQVTEVDLDTDERVVVKQQPVLGGYDPARYETAREWATAPDGARVPVSLVWRRGLERDGSAPCLLYGYGSYEASVPASFSSIRLNLLDRGFVYAIAHVRGGGELGRSWYEQGKLLSKRNTFTDFIACAEHLVAGGWTSPSRLAIRGASAGGLLVGAVLNMRPDLFAAAVAEVPFVDVVNSMSDSSLPLTVGEYEEWGNPEDPQYLAAMLEYSPYDNVTGHDYPALYVTAGFNDPRVSYHEPAKWVAKLRALNTGDRPILLRTELSAGHAGPSGRYEAWRDEARVQAFLLTALGVEAP